MPDPLAAVARHGELDVVSLLRHEPSHLPLLHGCLFYHHPAGVVCQLDITAFKLSQPSIVPFKFPSFHNVSLLCYLLLSPSTFRGSYGARPC